MNQARRTRGSALLAVLAISFIIAVSAMQLTVLVMRQGQLNRIRSDAQSGLADTERFAEETVAHYAAIVRHDGTISDHQLPGGGSGTIGANADTLRCERDLEADPSRIEAGLITVEMRERCDGDTNTRTSTLTYRLSADLRNVVGLEENARTVQLLDLGPVTFANITAASFQARFSVTSQRDGYLRVYIESSDPFDPQPFRLPLANYPVRAGGTVNVTAHDDFQGRTGARTIKALFSATPFPDGSEGTVRYPCDDGSGEVCGAESMIRGHYNPPGSLAPPLEPSGDEPVELQSDEPLG